MNAMKVLFAGALLAMTAWAQNPMLRQDGNGKVDPAKLPAAAASALGGVNSKDCSGTGHVQKINTDGTVTCSADSGGTSTYSGALAWSPWQGYGTATTGLAVVGTPNYGPAQSFVVHFPIAFTGLGVYVGTACSGTCGLIAGIFTPPTTSSGTFTPLCVVTPASNGGTVDPTTTGGKILTFASGANVSGGVCTLQPGFYTILLSSDNTALKLAYFLNAGTSYATVLGIKYPWGFISGSAATLSTGTGSSIAFNGSITGTNLGTTAVVQPVAFEIGLLN